MSRKLVRFEEWGNYSQSVVCPNCNGDYLHQSNVAIFTRGEDEDQVKVTTVDGDGDVHEAVIANSISLNPSRRRYGLRISFWCEQCDAELTDEEKENGRKPIGVPDLAIYQEKGITYIEWVD